MICKMNFNAKNVISKPRVFLMVCCLSLNFGGVSVYANQPVQVDESVEERSLLSTVRKENVRTSEVWTDYRRVSDNISTGNATGSIYTNRNTSLCVSFSGNINGLGVNLLANVQSAKDYSFNVPRNSSVYIGYRIRTGTETGTRVVYLEGTNIVSSRNNYTFTMPLYGEYALINTSTGDDL